jgi:predicted Na+-dependent transporter
MLIFFALIIWLVINYTTWGFDFNQNLCIVAGLFLIMPSLLKFHFKDLAYFKNHKKIFFINLFFNFVLLPFIFLGIWYLFFWANPIVFAFLLLWMIPGWWLLISWVMNSNWNVKLAFSLFLVNLFIFSILFIPFAKVLDTVWEKVVEEKAKQEKIIQKKEKNLSEILNYNFNNQNNFLEKNIKKEEKEKTKWCVISKISEKMACPVLWKVWASKSAFIALFVLIILPFIISRFILISNKLSNFLIPKIQIISKIATFFIIAYIFSIKEVNNIFTSEISLVIKLSLAIILIYLIVYRITYFLHKKIWNNPDTNAFFWNSTTRFLTLWLIFSFFYVKTFWTEFLLVFVIAYFVQIIGSNIIFMKMKK